MNKEKISKGKHQYYEKNKERLLAYCKKWHSNNKDRVRENRRKYMERHLGQAERDAARLKKWASEHPERKNIGRKLLRSKYVASVIARRNGIIRADIPTVLIDLKREQLRIQRLLRTMK